MNALLPSYDSIPDLPREVALFVELIGEEATLLLLEQHGGTRLEAPAGENTRLANAIGRSAARALYEHFGRDRFKVPLAKAWRARIYRQRGMSYTAIARRLGCNETSVWRYLNAVGATNAQLELFP
jgi:hypothetical protein